VSFGDAINNPDHLHESTECTICDISDRTCDLPEDFNKNRLVDVDDILHVLSMFNIGCD
jgi:hypothetical protein